MPKSNKRKAGESADPEEPPAEAVVRGPVKKLSKKKELHQEAIRRAQAWAEEEKKKAAAKKAKREAAENKAEESDDEDVAEPQPRKRMKVEESPAKKPLEYRQVGRKSAGGGENAFLVQEQSSRQSATTSSQPRARKSPARTSRASTGHRKKLAPASFPAPAPAASAPGVAVDNAAMQAVYASAGAATVPGGGPFMVQQPVAGFAPYPNSGYMIYVPGSSPPFASAPATNRGAVKGAEDDEDDVCPPPPIAGLEHQISQQVLANVQASLQNKPTVDSFAPEVHEAAMKATGDEEIDEISFDEDNEPTMVGGVDDTAQQAEIVALKKRADQATKWAFIFGVLACFIYVVRMPMPPSTISSNVVNNEPPPSTCFFDSQTEWEGACPDGNGVPCPEGGVCRDGELVGCLSSFKEVAESGKSCTVTDEFKIMKAFLMKELEDHATQHQTCDETNVSLLNYDSVQQAHPEIMVEEGPELVEMLLEEGFTVETDDNGLHLGLPNDHYVGLPIYCHIGNAFKVLLEIIGSWMVYWTHFAWNIAIIVLRVFWNCAYAYPLASAIGFGTVVSLYSLKAHGDERRKKTLDIANMRQMAYSTLQDNPQCSHLVVHIRDEIAMCLAEFNRDERQHLIKHIWPKVVSDVKLDNRVRKSQRIGEASTLVDAWQWVATTTPKSARFASDTS